MVPRAAGGRQRSPGTRAAPVPIKRRVRIAPGKSWLPFDQVDWIAGGLLAAAPFSELDAPFVATALLVAPVASMATHWLGYLLRLNEEPL